VLLGRSYAFHFSERPSFYLFKEKRKNYARKFKNRLNMKKIGLCMIIFKVLVPLLTRAMSSRAVRMTLGVLVQNTFFLFLNNHLKSFNKELRKD